MSPIDREYPRMLFHRKFGSTTVYSMADEESLGPGWSRTILAQQPAPPKPQEDEEEDDEPDTEKPEKPAEREPKPKSLRRYANRQ